MRGACSSGSLYATPVSHLWFTRVTCLFSVTREIFIRCRLPLTFFYIPPATSIFNTVDVDIRYDWRKWYFVPSYAVLQRSRKVRAREPRRRGLEHTRGKVLSCEDILKRVYRAYARIKIRGSDIDKHEVVKRVHSVHTGSFARESVRTLNK